nr:ribosomal protein L24 [Proteomonas sp. NEIS-1375]
MKKTTSQKIRHIKKGDNVKILAGNDKGKISEVLEVLQKTNQVVVKEVNIKKKHVKPRKEGDVGKIIQFEAPVHSSNVMLYSEENKMASRIGYQTDATGNKVRVLKKLLATS